MILTWLAYGMLFLSILSFIIAYYYYVHFYWSAAIGMYVFSFFGGFSIGQLTVGLTFIPLTLAIAHLFRYGNNRKERLILFVSGCVIGLLVIIFARHIIFYPLLWLLTPLLS